MMELPIEPSEVTWSPDHDHLTATVCVDGSWNGGVSLDCSSSYACKLASQFLAMDPPDTVNDDVRDALGELANMIGGNVKAAMGAGLRISVPMVVDGPEYALRICGSVVQSRLGFQSIGGEFWVTIFTKDGQSLSTHYRSTAQEH